MSGSSSELQEVQEKLRTLNTEYDKLSDEWRGKLAAQQDEFQGEKHALLQDSSARLQAAKEEAESKNAALIAELDKLRRAFSGDPLGWVAGTDEQGKPYYYNPETGESDYDKPRILEIAEVVQNIDALDEGKKKQDRAVKKGKEAELHARKLEISLNETRAEAAALRKTKKAWEECGTAITSVCTTMTAAIDDTDARVKQVEERIPVVDKAVRVVNAATVKVKQLQLELDNSRAMTDHYRLELGSTAAEIESTRERADKLEARFTQAVEERVDEVRLPLEDELAVAYAGRQEEKALRESDRRYLADLWPEGWLIPSMLRRFRSMSPEERAQQTLKMEELEAERDLVEGIRAGVAAAAKWEVKKDDYGREYYTNWETGEALYDPPPEMLYRPTLGRNELGENVDPRLQALSMHGTGCFAYDRNTFTREWEQGTDGWGKAYWQNTRSGDVVQIEPKGLSEAVGLEEHELEGWEGPTQGEKTRDVAVEAARVVMTWLNKAREAEEKRSRAMTAPLALGGGEASDASDSEEDDGEQDEFVYDIQTVEELAMGDEGWTYQAPSNGENQGEQKKRKSSRAQEREEMVLGVVKLKGAIAKLARREDRFEKRLTLVRRNLEELAHDLLAAKRKEEEETLQFAIGHGSVKDVHYGENGTGNQKSNEETKGSAHKRNRPKEECRATVTTVVGAKYDTAELTGNTVGDALSEEVAPALEARKCDAVADQDGGKQNTQQSAGETAAECGAVDDRGEATSKIVQQEDADPKSPSSPAAAIPENNREADEQSAEVASEPLGRDPRSLPDSVAQNISLRAFPLSEESISCAAFHALAAEAVWAGLNGSDRVEKPSKAVWDARGGDRWGTAAFFAESLGKREEEALPGFPHTEMLHVGQAGNEGSSGGHPLSGSAARHAATWTVSLAAMSSRRGFLKKAAEVAAQEARQHMHDIEKRSIAVAPSSTGENGGDVETANISGDERTESTTVSGGVIGPNNEAVKVVGEGATDSEGECSRYAAVGNGNGNGNGNGRLDLRVLRSPVMLEFGAELPGHVAIACGRAVQFPIPNGWDDPEAREKQFAAQTARRKETLETLRARDKAPINRPKGYEANTRREGKEMSTPPRDCQDAAELLRYEAVVLEKMLHHTLVEVNNVQTQLEAGRIKALNRWKQFIKAEQRTLENVRGGAFRRQTVLAKLSMEIRGLRVPLVEPQPPAPPRLDPGGMKPPPLVPGAQKTRSDEVEGIVDGIRGGKYDHGEGIILPEGKTLSSGQFDEVAAALKERQAEVVILLEEETSSYEEAVGVYEYKHREWERLEIERKERLSSQCHQSRLDNLSLDTLVGLKRSHGEHLVFLRVEASADESITEQSEAAKARFKALLAKQIAEEARAYDWVLQLQVELSDALRDREALERLPDAALNRLDTLRWEQLRAEGMFDCRRRVAELRECLVEEGRRRRQLYDERKWAAQSELRRVRAESVAAQEKESMLRLLLKVVEAAFASRASILSTRQNEAARDMEGTDTEGTVSPGEVYASKRVWISEEYKQADAELKDWEEKLEEILHIRTLARQRETTVGELVLGAARGALPPPHPDQWLPKVDKKRHDDEVRLLLERHSRELRAEEEKVEAAQVKVREAVREVVILRAKLQAMEGWRDHEIIVVRAAGRDAVDSVKGLLARQRAESAARIDSLEQALSEIRKEYNEVRSELTTRVEVLNRGRSNTEAWVKALKHDLAMERTKSDIAEQRLESQTARAKVSSEKLRTELRSERMHSLRLELWIAALHDEIRLLEKAQEDLRRQQAMEREEHEKHVRDERHHVWRHRTAVRLLCTSVDSLFLFFAQRLANLAGSRRTHNDALRANGAVEVLAAVCRGPRKDLRRLATRALGALGWDGKTEARVLAWDIYRQWDLWVETCCPAEEERLRRRGRTFQDPEKFEHADEIASYLTPQPQNKIENTETTTPLVDAINSNLKEDGSDPESSAARPLAQASPDEEGTRDSPGEVVDREARHDTLGAGGVEKWIGLEGDPVEAPREPDGLQTEEEDTEEHIQTWMLQGDSRPRDHVAVIDGDHQADEALQGRGNSNENEAEVRKEDPEQEDEETDEEFRPKAAMSARAVVRARRQWALRRARRHEGPNEANQLELGGGAGVTGEVGPAGGCGGVDNGKDGNRLIEGCGRNVVALLARLCQERNDWEVVRAAVSALSVAAYHEANADRMGKAAPNLIPVLVDLLAHPDAEIQAHTATALANLAHGSPTYQSDAGAAGAIEALLDVCRGRAGAGEEHDIHPMTTVKCTGQSENHGETGVTKVATTGKVQSESESTKKANEKEQESGTGERWARKTGKGAAIEAMAASAVKVMAGEGNLEEDGEEGEVVDTMDVDAVQAATAALANLLCYSDVNSVRLVAAGGIGVLVGLVSSHRPHNLLDFDQAEEIQANCAEALVNATRNQGVEAAARIHSLGISPLVLMCGSDNLQVKRHAALVLGNMCQTDSHRATAGEEGAVEGLFALCDTDDGVVRANALWALGNLAWDPRNQERIGRYTSQLLSLVSSTWTPVRTNALVCLGNALFFHEPNRRRVESVDGALFDLLGYCGKDHPAPVQEAALRCLVSLTYVDRIVAPLAEAGCITTFVESLDLFSVPGTVRHPAGLALLNVSVHDRYKAQVAEAGGVEAAVALLGSNDSEERELAAKILTALASTEGDEDKAGGVDGGRKEKLDLSHLVGIVKMDGNPPAQKAAAEQIAQAVSNNVQKQRDLGVCGGVEALLDMCDPERVATEARLLVPVLWSLRNSLHNNTTNKNRFFRAGGLERIVQLCQSSRSAGEWAVAEGVLTTLVTASLGNENICRRLLRVGLDQLIDAAEDKTIQDNTNNRDVTATDGLGPRKPPPTVGSPSPRGVVKSTRLPAVPSPKGGRGGISSPSGAVRARGPAADVELGLDQIDEIGVDGVIRESTDALRRRMKGESRETCSALATSLLQSLGPFNYVVCEHCGAREKGGTTCSQCGYAITFEFTAVQDAGPVGLIPRP